MNHAIRALRLGALAVALACGACTCGDKPKQHADAGPGARTIALRALPAEAAADVVAYAQARVPPRKGSCAQVRSLPDENKAREVAEQIRAKLALPVELLRADLKDKGVWFRVCVGDEESAARLVTKATEWTLPGGALEPFLDAPDGAPRFFVQERETAEPRAPSAPAAKALLEGALVDGAPLYFVGGPAADALWLAGTATTTDGAPLVIAASPAGTRAQLVSQDAPGCAACELALRNVVTTQRAVGAGDLSPAPGDELLIEETTPTGDRLLSVLAVQGDALVRVAGVVLAKSFPGVVLSGVAKTVEADSDSQREIVVTSSELRTQRDPAGGENACALERHAALYDVTASGIARIDVLQAPPSSAPVDAGVPNADHVDERALAAIVALDVAGDHDLASRACAAVAARTPSSAATRLCMERLRTLAAQNETVAATNAGALFAQAAPGLRAAVATSFFNAASVLDADPRLLAEPPTCEQAPLVRDVGSRDADENIALAAAKQSERRSLAELDDSVFVTAIRDFGADTPVGTLATKWLDRMRVVLPARHAAIEALLLPPAPPGSESGIGNGATGGLGATDGDGGPGFGGTP